MITFGYAIGLLDNELGWGGRRSGVAFH
jgi:hypothetical protein